MNSENPYLKLKQQYTLSEDHFQTILRIIIRTYTGKAVLSHRPTAIILGAQPGAGKSELQKEAEYRLLKNVVVCNADNLRDYHPLAKEVKQKYPVQYPDITAEYAQHWNDELCRYCRAHKLNYILETTFSSGERLNKTIQEIKKDGYHVDIKLLAVDSRLSLLGAHMRYEDNVLETGMGRQVSRKAHDERFKAIPNTIKKVQEARLYDNLYIYARTVVLEGTIQIEGVEEVAHNPADPLKVYMDELQRAWPEKLQQYFNAQYRKVLSLMKSRKASLREIETFQENVGVKQAPKQKLSQRKGQKKGPRL